MIACAWKELFKVTPLADNNNDLITLATARSKKWVPINKATDRTMTLPATITDHKRHGATFAADTYFKESEGQMTKMTPAKAHDGTEGKEDSLANTIARAQKELFKVTPPADNNDNLITLATARSKKWVPINKVKDRTMTSPATNTGHKRCGATFTADTYFKEREGQTTKMTPAKAQDGTGGRKIAWLI